MYWNIEKYHLFLSDDVNVNGCTYYTVLYRKYVKFS